MINSLSSHAKAHPGFQPEWGARDRDVVFANPRMGLIQHVVVCDANGTARFDQPVVALKPGVICVAVDRAGRLALLRHFRPICFAPGLPEEMPITRFTECGVASLEFPRGGVEAGETPSEAARREVGEEVGAEVLKVTPMDFLNTDTAIVPYANQVFLLEVDSLRASPLPADPFEDIEVQFLPLPRVLDLVADGRIFCGQTKGALASYLAYLGRKGILAKALEPSA